MGFDDIKNKVKNTKSENILDNGLLPALLFCPVGMKGGWVCGVGDRSLEWTTYTELLAAIQFQSSGTAEAVGSVSGDQGTAKRTSLCRKCVCGCLLDHHSGGRLRSPEPTADVLYLEYLYKYTVKMT